MLTKILYDEHGEWMGSIEEEHFNRYIARVLVDSYLDDIFEKNVLELLKNVKIILNKII